MSTITFLLAMLIGMVKVILIVAFAAASIIAVGMIASMVIEAYILASKSKDPEKDS